MRNRNHAGVTLIEMLVVVSIIAIVAGISFPSAVSGIDSIRLATAADSVASFLGGAVNLAERRQLMIELTVSPADHALVMRAPGVDKRYDLPPSIGIAGILPEVPIEPGAPRHFLLYPGGAPPRIGIRLANAHGAQRIVSLDPVTGAAQIERQPTER